MRLVLGMIGPMSNEGIGPAPPDGQPPKPAAAAVDRPLEGPGSDTRLRSLQDRFRTSQTQQRASTFQLVAIALFVFLLILIFGAGRFIIADLAPKPPPGVVLNTISDKHR
jgi:hypothetical protein